MNTFLLLFHFALVFRDQNGSPSIYISCVCVFSFLCVWFPYICFGKVTNPRHLFSLSRPTATHPRVPNSVPIGGVPPPVDYRRSSKTTGESR